MKRKTVYGDKEIEPKRTDYNEGSKGKSSKSESKSGKKTKSKSNYNKETKTKENKRKGPLVPNETLCVGFSYLWYNFIVPFLKTTLI